MFYDFIAKDFKKLLLEHDPSEIVFLYGSEYENIILSTIVQELPSQLKLNGNIKNKMKIYNWFYMTRWLNILNTLESHVKVESAKFYSETDKKALTFTHETQQARSIPPPIGILLNDNIYCYMVSVLTILFSIPEVVEAIYTSPNSKHREVCLDYIWCLNTGMASKEQLISLNQRMVHLSGLERFSIRVEDDSIDFATEFTRVCMLRFPKLYKLLTGFFPTKQDIKDDYLFTSYICIPHIVESKESTGGYLYKIVNDISEKMYSMEELISEKIEPHIAFPLDILIVTHDLNPREPRRLPLTSNINIRGTKYSLHGCSMYRGNSISGHYISMLQFHTSMYFYDSQYKDAVEDPKSYQTRFWCYVKV